MARILGRCHLDVVTAALAMVVCGRSSGGVLFPAQSTFFFSRFPAFLVLYRPRYIWKKRNSSAMLKHKLNAKPASTSSGGTSSTITPPQSTATITTTRHAIGRFLRLGEGKDQ